MNTSSKSLHPIIVAIILLIVVPYGIIQAESATTVNIAIEQADAARLQADGVGGEWRDTADMIKKAKDAAAKGDLTTALNLAHEAKLQGELGYAQSMRQQQLDFPEYLK